MTPWFFDKTGTLTKGVFRVSEIVNQPGYSREDLLGYAAKAEALSNHPIAKSIMLACRQAVNGDDVSLFEEHPGLGIKAVVNGKRVLAGNERLLRAENITAPQVERAGTLVHVAVDGEYAGYLIIADELRPDAVQALKGLRNLGVRRVVMLTGDSAKSAAQVARDVGVDTFYAGLLPEDKVQRLGELAQGLIDRRQRKIAFVGDGINDAPVIAGADLGIAMGGLGSDAAIEAADVVIMDDLLSKLPAAVEISRATRKIVFQNIVFALGVKSFFIVLGAIGLAGMWEAVFADVGVAVLAILNATRTVHLAV
ncbi:MAG TPA: HAD-IC family P-type ATPase [Desulfobacteria bacterium]|nr:HAD-IC family P-type ATPase [Desulfobacteria bacterium]